MNSENRPKLLPVSVVSFKEIRQRYIYVDKTDLIAQFAQDKAVFLARPRRFGKSLLVSTLQSLFEYGLQDFAGLAIEQLWHDKTYKVIYLNFWIYKATTIEKFKELFIEDLTRAARELGIQFTANILQQQSSPTLYFKNILDQLGSEPVVLLIDEYDAPLNESMDDEKKYEAIRDELEHFYSIVKTYSNKLRFVFITGITRYSEVSIFSAFNNISDITLQPQFGTLLGYTEQELDRYFLPYLQEAAGKYGMTVPELKSELKSHYNGFCFDYLAMSQVYNPWSVLKFLQYPAPQVGFLPYWYDTGGLSKLILKYFTSLSFLQEAQIYTMRLISESNSKLQNISLDELSLRNNIRHMNYRSLMLQTGYLTIKKGDGYEVSLGIPDKEIEYSLIKLFFRDIMRLNFTQDEPYRNPHISRGDFLALLQNQEQLAVYIDEILHIFGYDTNVFESEASLRDILYFSFVNNDVTVQRESLNARGRADLIVEIGACRFVFELKLARRGDSPEHLLQQATDQIKDRQYGKVWPHKQLVSYALVISGPDRKVRYLQEI